LDVLLKLKIWFLQCERIFLDFNCSRLKCRIARSIFLRSAGTFRIH